jgi:hypothetical protein
MDTGANVYIHVELTAGNRLDEQPQVWKFTRHHKHVVIHHEQIWVVYTRLSSHTGLLTWGVAPGIAVQWGGVQIVGPDGRLQASIEPQHVWNNSISLRFHATGSQELVVYGAVQSGMHTSACRMPHLDDPVLSN